MTKRNELQPAPDDDRILNRSEVAEMINVKPKTISNWLAGGNDEFPRGFKLGDGLRAPRVWRKRSIRLFLHHREQIAA